MSAGRILAAKFIAISAPARFCEAVAVFTRMEVIEVGLRSGRPLVFCAMPGCLLAELPAATGRLLENTSLAESPALKGDCRLAGDWLDEGVVAGGPRGLIAMGECDWAPRCIERIGECVGVVAGLCLRGVLVVVAEGVGCDLVLMVPALCDFSGAAYCAALAAALADARSAECEGICAGETCAEGETFPLRAVLGACVEAARLPVRGDLRVGELE